MKVNGRDLTNDEMDRRLGRQYRKLMDHHVAGDCDHPGTIPVGQMHKVLKDCADRAPARDEDPDPAAMDSPGTRLDANHGVQDANDSAPDRVQTMAEAFGESVYGPGHRKHRAPW